MRSRVISVLSDVVICCMERLVGKDLCSLGPPMRLSFSSQLLIVLKRSLVAVTTDASGIGGRCRRCALPRGW